jgi:hypothetical protein
MAQTVRPSALRPSVNAGVQEEIDTLYRERPAVALGWNWGGALLGVNADMRIRQQRYGDTR